MVTVKVARHPFFKVEGRDIRLDLPLTQQFWLYLVHLFQGDFGPSFHWRDFSVNELLAKALPISMRLGAEAMVVALVAGATSVGAILLTSGATTSAVEGWIPVGTVAYLEARADLPEEHRRAEPQPHQQDQRQEKRRK